jgi:hypothetical protein
MSKPRAFSMIFAKIYPLYIEKAERKGRHQAEVDEIIFWLTGYNNDSLKQQIDNNATMESFFLDAPQINEKASLIKGVICGYRVEEIEDETMRNIRYLDKLIDELAKGKAMTKILRK